MSSYIQLIEEQNKKIDLLEGDVRMLKILCKQLQRILEKHLSVPIVPTTTTGTKYEESNKDG